MVFQVGFLTKPWNGELVVCSGNEGCLLDNIGRLSWPAQGVQVFTTSLQVEARCWRIKVLEPEEAAVLALKTEDRMMSQGMGSECGNTKAKKITIP